MIRRVWLAALMILTLGGAPHSRGADKQGDDAGVGVKFDADAETELQPLREGVRYFLNRRYTLTEIPKDLSGLTFTSHAGGKPHRAAIDVPAGATVYVLIDGENGMNGNVAAVRELHQSLATSGWARAGDTAYNVPQQDRTAPLSIYKQTFAAHQQVTVNAAGFSGIVIAAKHLAIKNDLTIPPATTAPVADRAIPAAGPTTRFAKLQTSIEGLYVMEQASGILLGGASEVILTATPGSAGTKPTPVTFATPVGPQMHIVLDDALRAVRTRYPRWDVASVVISFENKYNRNEGGSIGAALGTLLLSAIQGVELDSHAAITGDVTSDGKVRAIGGVAAKLRGATAAGCSIVALPAQNVEQLTDAALYESPAILYRVQVLAISDLDEALAVTRTDRPPPLAKAILLFGEIEQLLKDRPRQLESKAIADRLEQVLELAPNHLSAKVLLMFARNKQPRTLSLAASRYYATVAVKGILPSLEGYEKDKSGGGKGKGRRSAAPATLSAVAVDEGLKNLDKTRGLADPAIRPLIDALQQFVKAVAGQAAPGIIEARANSVLDEMAKLDTNVDLMQKMVNEGI